MKSRSAARDYRGGGRSSARETAMRVAAGAIAKKYLKERYGVCVRGYLSALGPLRPAAFSWDPVEENPFFWPHAAQVPQGLGLRDPFPGHAPRLHELVEAGEPVTAERLNTIYGGLIEDYYGPGYTMDPDDPVEWAYIPHFYYKYYVYSYATGLTSGIAIADRVKRLGEPAAEAFLGMLEAGASAPPLELLAGAGVDLTKPDALDAAMRTFEETLNQVEQLMAEK